MQKICSWCTFSKMRILNVFILFYKMIDILCNDILQIHVNKHLQFQKQNVLTLTFYQNQINFTVCCPSNGQVYRWIIRRCKAILSHLIIIKRTTEKQSQKFNCTILQDVNLILSTYFQDMCPRKTSHNQKCVTANKSVKTHN